MPINQFTPPLRQLDPIFHIEVEKIKPNPYQPRRNFDEESLKELASSIREFGILHPLVVTKQEIPIEGGTAVEYYLISGERRLMAAKIAGLERVPAIIKSVPSEQERLELAIIENIQRENLNPIETARAYAKLQDQFGLTQREVAVRVGKSREVVANTVRLLNLPTEAQEAVARGKISESQARLLLAIEDMKDQQALLEDLLQNNLTVRELRDRIQIRKAAKAPSPETPPQDPATKALEDQLREILGAPVKVQKDGASGKVMINFYSEEELRSIIEKISKTVSEPTPIEPPKLDYQGEFNV